MINIGFSITKNKSKFDSLINQMFKNFKLPGHKVNCIFLPTDNDIKNNLKNLDILLTYNINKNYFNNKSNNLKWIHLGNAGVDNSLFTEVIKSNILISNSRGINSGPVSEFVFSVILFLSKNLQDCLDFKLNKKWTQWDIAKKNETLNNQTIGIIGYGAIGQAIAKKARAFDMNVIAIRKHQKKQESNINVNELLPLKKINYLLSKSKYIIIACPLTPLTKNLITKSNLKLISSQSYIINVSRGSIINEKDLITHLENKLIKGAILDVFQKEPLNKNNKLFNLDNAFLSPHISGNFKDYQIKVIESFAKNLLRYIDNKKIINLICKKQLY